MEERSLSPETQPDRETFERVWKRVMPDQPPGTVRTEGALPSPPVPPREPILDLMDLAARQAAAFRTLSARGGPAAHTLSAISADWRKAFRQLSTVRFLITGQRYRPRLVPSPLPARTDPALRERWLACLQWAGLCEKAAAAAREPILKQLYPELKALGLGHAGVLRALLEQRCPPP